MNIIAGQYKGLKLESAPHPQLRPTLQRIKENVFNVLSHNDYLPNNTWQGLKVLDVFAGTGQLGLEAFSRGATRVCFIEHHPDIRAILRRNIEKTHAQGATRVFSRPAETADSMPPSAGGAFDVIFCDPPYQQNLCAPTLHALAQGGWCAPHAVAYCESDMPLPIDEFIGWQHLDTRHYGSVYCTFLRFASIEKQLLAPE